MQQTLFISHVGATNIRINFFIHGKLIFLLYIVKSFFSLSVLVFEKMEYSIFCKDNYLA